MRFNRRSVFFYYLLSDSLAAMIAWGVMFIFRKTYIAGYKVTAHPDVVFDNNFYLGIFLIPLFWIVVYFVTGIYREFFRKSRLTELYKTFVTSLAGVIFLFIALILDDIIGDDYKNYYRTILVLFSGHFFLTFLGRLLILNRIKSLVRRGKIGYNTIIVGGNESAFQLYKEIGDSTKGFGYKVLGYVETNGGNGGSLKNYLPKLGKLNELESITGKDGVEEVIIAIESSEHHRLNAIINSLAGQKVIIKIIPDMYDILSGSVKMGNVIGAPLIEIYPEIIPFWQKIVKRGIDISCSLVALFLMSPLMLFIALRVKASSAGPVFFAQERIGLGGKPFNIYKFRSMFVDAESGGPQLSSKNDPRITKWGRVMRKWRFDELPQFYNILIGDMSLVGPRPERRYFIDRLIEVAPAYKHLQKVKPGLTSWGMVKFGYAENIDQMVERMKWDLLYIENMSLAIDFKIMIYTGLIILQGKGK